METTDLAWPRILTGLARMSKSAADVGMVGIALGSEAIAGVGFGGPYWGLAFSTGGGLAAGTIALVSQRWGAEAFEQLGQAIRSSVLLVIITTVPLSIPFVLFPQELISLLSSDPVAIQYGTEYLRVLAFGVPFAALNLVYSRALIGMNDAWTPMVVRAGGAIGNIVLNAIFIFSLGMGTAGAGLGTVLANVGVTAAFVIGFAGWRIPGIGAFPVSIRHVGKYADLETMRDVFTIGLPVIGRNSVWTIARFPMLGILDMFGSTVVAAYIISRRIWGLMNTPGWGFGLAASSLVGQSLGEGDEETAEIYGREIIRFSTATYMISAGIVALFARPIVHLFVDSPNEPTVPIAIGLVYAASLAIIAKGVDGTAAGALDATGDTKWTFYSRVLGMFGAAIPIAYVGAITPLGIWGVYLAFFGETLIPAAINYYRFHSGKWKVISREYRPDIPTTVD